jgi:hypothetical protein
MILASSISWGSITCWDRRGFRIELRDELFHDLGICFVLCPFKDEILASDQFAAADEEDLHAGFPVTARHGKHIGVEIIGREDDTLPLNMD